MELLPQFFADYGLAIGLIALAGVIVLGVLKYCKVFEKIANEQLRHLVYILCSVGLTLIGIMIYLLCTTWDWTVFLSLVPIIWGLNQAMYNVFKATKLNDLCAKILDFLKKLTTENK